MADKLGLGAAIDAHGGVGPAPAAGAEQLDLLPPLPLAERGAPTTLPRPDRPGRPPGVRNRRTEELIAYIGARYQLPAIVLAEIYSRPVRELATELGCKLPEALALQVSAAKELLPYLHQKQPLAVDVSGAGVIGLTILGLPPGADEHADLAPDDGSMTLEGTPTKSEG